MTKQRHSPSPREIGREIEKRLDVLASSGAQNQVDRAESFLVKQGDRAVPQVIERLHKSVLESFETPKVGAVLALIGSDRVFEEMAGWLGSPDDRRELSAKAYMVLSEMLAIAPDPRRRELAARLRSLPEDSGHPTRSSDVEMLLGIVSRAIVVEPTDVVETLRKMDSARSPGDLRIFVFEVDLNVERLINDGKLEEARPLIEAATPKFLKVFSDALESDGALLKFAGATAANAFRRWAKAAAKIRDPLQGELALDAVLDPLLTAGEDPKLRDSAVRILAYKMPEAGKKVSNAIALRFFSEGKMNEVVIRALINMENPPVEVLANKAISANAREFVAILSIMPHLGRRALDSTLGIMESGSDAVNVRGFVLLGAFCKTILEGEEIRDREAVKTELLGSRVEALTKKHIPSGNQLVFTQAAGFQALVDQLKRRG